MVTCIINTYNAELHLKEVIEALRSFDEILVCDMESTDSTTDIARSMGCRVITFPKGNHVCAEPARDFALRNAGNPWVLFVDADEIIPPALAGWIDTFVKNPGDVAGVRIPRKNLLMDIWKRDEYPDYQLRLMLRDKSMWPPTVHSQPRVDGKIIDIPRRRHDLAMIHISVSLSEVLERYNRYTTAEISRRPVKKTSLAALIIKPWIRFFKAFFIKGGFREGVKGYISAKNASVYKFYTLAKMHEEACLREKETHNNR